ncbi:RAB6A [Symbiodinium sp. CCMP2592]|nr:RAB6A [Symbiodinium sp. CCMP2592]
MQQKVDEREDSDALLQEDTSKAEPPYGPLGLGSLGSFSNFGSMGYGPGMSSGASSGSPFLSSFSGVLGSPKSPSPPGMPSMPPLVSSVSSKESKDKKEIDFTNIDYIGCIIPQWTDGDWICAEAVDVPDMQIYDDAQHRSFSDFPGPACKDSALRECDWEEKPASAEAPAPEAKEETKPEEARELSADSFLLWQVQ